MNSQSISAPPTTSSSVAAPEAKASPPPSRPSPSKSTASEEQTEAAEDTEIEMFADGSGEDLTSSSAALEAALSFDLPFPSEASVGAGVSADEDALFELPDVADLEKKRKSREEKRVAKASNDASVEKSIREGAAYDDFEALYGSESGVSDQKAKKRIQRKDLKELNRLLELDPLADYDEGTFVKSYDSVSAVLGESGRSFLGIGSAYLQAGHAILLLTCLIGAFVEYPGNPLTEFPAEIRGFLKTGLALVLAVNVGLAAFAVPTAGEKNQPVPLWAAKSFVLGGLAFDELNRAPRLKSKNKNKKRNRGRN